MTQKNLTAVPTSLKTCPSHFFEYKNFKKKEKKGKENKSLKGMCIPEAVCFCISLCLLT